MLLGILQAANLLGNVLTRKGVIRAAEGVTAMSRDHKWLETLPGTGTIRASQNF